MKLKEFVKENLFLIIIVFLFTLISIINIENYGMSWDEPVQRQIGEVNLNHIKNNSNSLELNADLRFYGPFYEINNILVANTLKYATNYSDIASHHFLGIILSAIAIIFLYLLTKKLFSKKIAIYSILFFCLYPWIIAHAQYNTKDIPVMNFAIIIIFFLYKSFIERKVYATILAGIFLGFAIDTKITSLIILPIFFIPYLIIKIIEFKNENIIKSTIKWKEEIKLLSIFSLTTVIITYLCWPALWKNPLFIIESVKYFLNHSWGGEILYLGNIYNPNTLPWHYALIYLIIVTPIITLICFILGIINLIKLKKEKLFEILLIIFWFLIPLLMELKPDTVVYGGIRHFFIIIPAMCIIAGSGFDFMLKKIEFKTKYDLYKIEKIAIAIITGILLIQIISIHPYEGSYFNEAIQIAIPSHIENYFEIEYWGTSYKEAINWVNKNAEINSIICVSEAPFLINFYKVRADLKFECNENSNYLMFFTINAGTKVKEYLDNYKAVYNITRFNSVLLYIYKIR